MNWEVEINESIDERIERDGYDSLSEPERLYHGVWWLLFVAYGPGFIQYFRDTPWAWVAAARKGLSAIRADGMASLLDQAIALLPNGELPVDAASAETVFEQLKSEREDRIEEVCGRFTDEPYPEESLAAYAQTHDDRFTGPRTRLELWQSKIDRGVDTTPQYTAKVMDFEKEAEKDRPYSSRSCPHCGYPTPDYRARCKRCDYPHGKA
ncbi:MAG: DUF4375 domain-containing protein [Planctomycetes bacterium]|nr:DUF4375 domain-containing protein [Planctomycetota bacterium]MBL7040977.1 DUF4375 domain-containing protein [Pirellulaceae bacterium]